MLKRKMNLRGYYFPNDVLKLAFKLEHTYFLIS